MRNTPRILVLLLCIRGAGVTSDLALSADNRPGNSAVSALFSDSVIVDNAEHVRRNALELPADERLKILLQWVLPTEERRHCRLGADVDVSRPPHQHVTSPVFDLLQVAEEQGQLESLARKLDGLTPSDDDLENRRRLAIRILLLLTQKDPDAADEVQPALKKLLALFRESEPEDVNSLWPEFLVAFYGTHFFPQNEDVKYFAELLFTARASKNLPESLHWWRTQLFSLTQRIRHADLGNDPAKFDLRSSSADWVVADRVLVEFDDRAAPSRWLFKASEAQHTAGNHSDFIFYRLPLTGSFEVTGQVLHTDVFHCTVGGHFLGYEPARGLVVGTFADGAEIEATDWKPSNFGNSKWFRLTVSDDVASLYLSGKLVQVRRLPPQRDPWFAIRAWWHGKTTVRDIRISDASEIPEHASLSDSESLAGWLPFHMQNWGNGEGDEAQIRGELTPKLKGCRAESLIRYHRPLNDGESIEYEFFYEPGRQMVHPVIDRDALIVTAKSVDIRSVTSGRFQSTVRANAPLDLVRRDNTTGGPRLRPDQWNRASLSLNGDVVALEINGAHVISHRLSPANDRVFGFIHDPGEEVARVKNVVMRGPWPDSVPASNSLSKSIVEKLNRTEATMSDSVTHDFSAAGLPPQFTENVRPGGNIVASPNGLLLTRQGNYGWAMSRLKLPFHMKGNFDVDVGFKDARLQHHEKYAGVLLEIHLKDALVSSPRLMRRFSPDKGGTLEASMPVTNRGGRRDFGVVQKWPCLSESGRLRIVRHEEKMYYLIAEEGSQAYHLAFETQAPQEDTVPGETFIDLLTNGSGSSQVLLTDLRVSADELYVNSAESIRPGQYIHTMNADGTNARRVSQPIEGINTQGSPEWSPDGHTIAFDGYTGRSSDTKMYLVNTDGTEQRSFAFGSMPTFSPDGTRVASTTLNRGLVTMNIDGSNEDVISRNGWGIQWSPDGKWLSFESYEQVNGRSARNIKLVHAQTRKERLLFTGDDAVKYRQIYWNMAWSRNSQHICFKGKTNDGVEMAVVSLDGSPVRILLDSDVQPDFSWHPDGNRILFSDHIGAMADRTTIDRTLRGRRMFEYDLRNDSVRLIAQPMDTENQSGTWSPDGTKIAYVSQAFLLGSRWRGRRPLTDR